MANPETGTRQFVLELTKDELVILQYAFPRGDDGDPLKNIYELGDAVASEDPYEVLAMVAAKIIVLDWKDAVEDAALHLVQIAVGDDGLYGLDRHGAVWRRDSGYWTRVNMDHDSVTGGLK